jgi:hypothetical protein
VTVQYTCGTLREKAAGAWHSKDSGCFVLLSGQGISWEAEGIRFSINLFFEHQPDHLGHLTARGLLHGCILQHHLFLHRDDLLEACFHHLSNDLFFESMMISSSLSDSGQVCSSFKTTPCPHYDLLDLCSRSSMLDFVCVEGELFLLWITMHPTRP